MSVRLSSFNIPVRASFCPSVTPVSYGSPLKDLLHSFRITDKDLWKIVDKLGWLICCNVIQVYAEKNSDKESMDDEAGSSDSEEGMDTEVRDTATKVTVIKKRIPKRQKVINYYCIILLYNMNNTVVAEEAKLSCVPLRWQNFSHCIHRRRDSLHLGN